jgi:hypothetical protein
MDFVRRLSIALSAAVFMAGAWAAPVGGGSSSVKPATAKAETVKMKKARCMGFEF